ncbi:hypothetical protein ACFROD_50285, partial [Streptomyces mirabilis]
GKAAAPPDPAVPQASDAVLRGRGPYAPQPGGGHRLHTLQALTVTGGRVAHNVVFADPGVFDVFGLPRHIPAGDFAPER